jgi:hypothetical protein
METNRCKQYWKISVRIGPLFQARIKGRDQLVMNLTRLSGHVQPSLHLAWNAVHHGVEIGMSF